jgi:hypothetical protein
VPPAQQVAAQEHSLGSQAHTPVSQQPQSQQAQSPPPEQAQLPSQQAAALAEASTFATTRVVARTSFFSGLAAEQHDASAFADFVAQQADAVFSLTAAVLLAQHEAVQSSQHSQEQAPGSQAQTPVAQQPQQSQGAAQAHGLLAANTPAVATAPVIRATRAEPTRNLNISLHSEKQLY